MSEFDAKQYWEATVHNRRETLEFHGGLDPAGRAVLFAADRIAELEAKLAAAEADAATQRDKVRVLREALDAISDSDPDESAGRLRDIANEALATTEDV